MLYLGGYLYYPVTGIEGCQDGSLLLVVIDLHAPGKPLGISFRHVARKHHHTIPVTGVEPDHIQQIEFNIIIDQSLKWHISSFNAKSSAVPKEWWPQVNRWLKRMGYRLVLRKFTYPAALRPNEKLSFTSWWENKGVAPCYKRFVLALRLKNEKGTWVLPTDADIRKWLPGDALYDDAVFVPAHMLPGGYKLSIALLDPFSGQPEAKLAIAGLQPDGWYPLGSIVIQ